MANNRKFSEVNSVKIISYYAESALTWMVVVPIPTVPLPSMVPPPLGSKDPLMNVPAPPTCRMILAELPLNTFVAASP